MGTPDFAATILEKLIQSGYEIAGVVTQPDKQKGRGRELSSSPVKQVATVHGITVYQPAKVRTEEFLLTASEINPDVIVVAAFGQILPKALLDLPEKGCINVHASLLPKYRGSAPIQYCVIDGEKETGITIMHMDVGIDTGDIILQEKLPIAPDETGGSLFDKLAKLGGEALVEALGRIENKTALRIAQDDSKANYVKPISKEMGNLDFTMPAQRLERLIRGLNPWPSAYTFLEGKTLKIWKAEVYEEAGTAQSAAYGEVIEVCKDGICVKTGEGVLLIRELQLEGKKRMSCDAFLRGFQVPVGTKLGF